jgi:hypothetical protein
MTKLEDLFGKKVKKEDDIKPLIDQMDKFSEIQDYENAQKALNDIKTELKKPSKEFNRIGDVQTIKDVNNMILSHPIRLNPDNYKFSSYLGLLVNVHNRKNEIQGARYIDTDRQRKVVAEEMACLGMTIPEKGGKGRKPNRAFLDIAHRINPSIACKELERREKVNMWKAIESGKSDEINKARERLKKYILK